MSAPEDNNTRFRDSVNIPIAIPAWGLLSLIVGAVFTAGIMVNKMDSLIENSKKSEDKIATIQEKQIISHAAIANLQQTVQYHEARLSAMERMSVEQGKPR